MGLSDYSAHIVEFQLTTQINVTKDTFMYRPITQNDKLTVDNSIEQIT